MWLLLHPNACWGRIYKCHHTFSVPNYNGSWLKKKYFITHQTPTPTPARPRNLRWSLMDNKFHGFQSKIIIPQGHMVFINQHNVFHAPIMGWIATAESSKIHVNEYKGNNQPSVKYSLKNHLNRQQNHEYLVVNNILRTSLEFLGTLSTRIITVLLKFMT